MRIVAVILSILAWTSAAAEQPASLHRVQAPGHNPLDCYCRARGRTYAPGESICLRTAQGPRLAECRMVTNVMSWSDTGRSCPES